ncbi:uncharacterized protein LOC144617099 [Panthera onca]
MSEVPPAPQSPCGHHAGPGQAGPRRPRAGRGADAGAAAPGARPPPTLARPGPVRTSSDGPGCRPAGGGLSRAPPRLGESGPAPPGRSQSAGRGSAGEKGAPHPGQCARRNRTLSLRTSPAPNPPTSQHLPRDEDSPAPAGAGPSSQGRFHRPAGDRPSFLPRSLCGFCNSGLATSRTSLGLWGTSSLWRSPGVLGKREGGPIHRFTVGCTPVLRSLRLLPLGPTPEFPDSLPSCSSGLSTAPTPLTPSAAASLSGWQTRGPPFPSRFRSLGVTPDPRFLFTEPVSVYALNIFKAHTLLPPAERWSQLSRLSSLRKAFPTQQPPPPALSP